MVELHVDGMNFINNEIFCAFTELLSVGGTGGRGGGISSKDND